MSYSDDLIKLRKRMLDALNVGFVDAGSKDLLEATLIQIMNEAERQRQICVSKADDLRRQAAIADGQASGFSQTSGIIYNVLNSYVSLTEKQIEQEKEAQRLNDGLNNETISPENIDKKIRAKRK